MKQFYKVTRPNGLDFHTGNTINYRINIGKTITNPKKTKSKKLCTADLIHASEFFFDALSYGDLPCSIFLVEGIPVSKQSDKAGFKELKIVKEIPTANWQNAFYSLVIWMLEDLKNNFDCKKEKNVTDAVNQAIQVFVNAQKTGKIDVLAAESAARSALSAGPAGFAVRSAGYATLCAKNAARSIRFAFSDESGLLDSFCIGFTVKYAALSAKSDGSATISAKKKEISDKFIGLLEDCEMTVQPNNHLVNRGEFHPLGWKHYDIPLGICPKCHHRVYSDEKHSIKSFIDITGNNDFSYVHDDECPKHRLEEVQIITVLKCQDCGVEERSYATNFLFLRTK